MPQQKFNKLAGARVLILGGTSGIGFSVAEGSLEHGASVVIASSNPDKVKQALARLGDAYPDHASRISGQACDLYDMSTMEANLDALLAFATKDGKKIDHLVNTAGSPGVHPPLADITPEHVSWTTARLAGILMLGKRAPAYMEAGPQASITFTTGTLLFKPIPGYTMGIGMAGAVDATARAFAISLAPLRVNVVAPGAIDTELLQASGKGNEEAKKATYQIFRDTNLLGTLGQPEDAAESYLFAMKCQFFTGQTILMDGGRLLK